MFADTLHLRLTHNEGEMIMPPQPADNYRMYDVRVFHKGRPTQKDHEFAAYLDLSDGTTLDPHLRFAAIRDGRDPATTVGEYMLEIREHGRNGQPIMRYATTRGIA